MVFLYGNGEDVGTHFFGATHFGIFDFRGVVGMFTPPSDFWGVVCGGELWLVVKSSLVGIGGF